MSLIDKLKKNSTIKSASALSKSKIFGKNDMIPTLVPMMNVALSGDPDGGLTPGVTVLAGPSRHFKTLFGLIMAKAYMDQYPDASMIFYDNEFGTTQSYIDSLNFDSDRILYTPFMDLEELKSDMVNQLKEIERGDKVFIFVDSLGNAASKKEVDDATEGKTVADMTRSKSMKSLFRMITPYLTVKDIPLVAIAHTYDTMEMYSKKVVSGGTGIMYSGNTVWIIGRQQEKDADKAFAGYNFVINIEKSRFVKDKAKIPITVTFDRGVNRWSGLLENALEAKIIAKPVQGKYQQITEDGEFIGDVYKERDIIANSEFWTNILKTTPLKDYLKNKYALDGAGKGLFSNDEVDLDVDDGDEE